MTARDSRGRFVSDTEAEVEAILQAAIDDVIGAIRVNDSRDCFIVAHLAEATRRADLLLAGDR